MAKKFLTSLKLVNLPSDPSVGSEGELYFNTSASIARIYKSGEWADLDTSGGGSITQEQVQDYIAPLFTNATNTNVIATYDDANNVINLNTSGSLISVDSIRYPDFITFDITPEIIPTEQGSIYWDSGDAGLRVVANDTSVLIGQEQYASVKNLTGSTISKGKVVYINGAQGQKPTVTLADADTELTSSKTFGFAAEDIIDGAEGIVVTEGILRGINTLGFTQGGEIYLSGTAGEFTQTKPTAPVNLVFLGYVVKAHASSGEVYVKIQNGYELEELHDVLISASVQSRESLVWNSASGLWINQLIATTTVSETAPASPSLGDTWYKQSTGSFFIYDGSYWVEVNGIIDSLTSDQVQDYASTLFSHNDHTNITATYDDANNKILLSIDLNPYLTQASASNTYLTQTSASNTYLTQSSGSSTYLTQTTASNTYLTQTAASSTYLTQTTASATYATKAEVVEISDITPLDNIKSRFNGIQTRFLPTYLGNTIAITNPYRLFLNINGIIQMVEYPELVWGSPLPRQGFWIDDDGYIVFSEAPLPGSTFDARMMAGSTTTTKTKLLYPFEASDILLGE